MINDIEGLLGSIDPSALSYNEWLSVGMALKEEGYPVSEWAKWSAKDQARYHEGECERKWNGFTGSAIPVTGGTIVDLARRSGYAFTRGKTANEKSAEIKGELSSLTPAMQLYKYIDALFRSEEKVSYVKECGVRGDRFTPLGAECSRTAGELKEALKYCSDIKEVIGDYNEKAGVWIRFNPVRGNGMKDSEVTDLKYALIESDALSVERQYEFIKETELPVAALVHSGNKSLHAIVHIGAKDIKEYKERVRYMYAYCKDHGFAIDIQNSNPSRLSRMPGVKRDGGTQYLLCTHTGRASFEEWRDHIEDIRDGLPDPENLSALYDDMPPLAPCLIEGVLRKGHKMLISGPSKAGKSFALTELCAAIAEGGKWLGFDCVKGKVLYINLELDRASCLHRFKSVYRSLGISPDNACNIDIWNLRGSAVPIERLAPKLIRRARNKGYAAIVIDPVYKIINGDENSADQMSQFCNRIDSLCSELGCAVIYCHHHSKGQQTMKKSIDRASGSGVFARDPDAILDLVEIEMTEGMYENLESRSIIKVCESRLKERVNGYPGTAGAEEPRTGRDALFMCRRLLDSDAYSDLLCDVEKAKKRVRSLSGWQLEATLREFPKISGVNIWFDHPLHKVDKTGTLEEALNDGSRRYRDTNDAVGERKEKRAEERAKALESAYEKCNVNGKATIRDMSEYMRSTEKTVRNHLKEHGGFVIYEGEVTKSIFDS